MLPGRIGSDVGGLVTKLLHSSGRLITLLYSWQLLQDRLDFLFLERLAFLNEVGQGLYALRAGDLGPLRPVFLVCLELEHYIFT